MAYAKSNKQINKEAEMSDQIDSPAVIAYRMGELEKAVRIGFEKHDEKLEKLVANFASASDMTAVVARVASLESDRKWLVRLVIGSVVFAMLALIGVGFKLNK